MATQVEQARGSSVEALLSIVKDGLCHRCGGCIGICPAGTLDLDADGYPIRVGECIGCGKCVRMCSGAAVDYLALGRALFGEDYHYNPFMGQFQSTHIGHALEEKVRWSGASGGVVTQLLIHLLESGRIKGALVATQDDEDPTLGRGIIARTRADLLASPQSRYTTTPSLAALREIAEDEGPYAVVGVPCQIHAVRQAQMIDPGWAHRVTLLIGLFCSSNPPCDATRSLVSLLAPPGTRLVSSHYRQSDERGWPHDTVELTFSDGSTWRSPYGPAQTVALLRWLTPGRRCLTCLDASAEFADISAADPWIRGADGDWKYAAPGGWTSLVVRTPAGRAALEAAATAGKVHVKPIPESEIVNGQRVTVVDKQRHAAIQLLLRGLVGRRAPSYSMNLPRPGTAAVLTEVAYLSMRAIAARPALRRPLSRLAFSRFGRRLMGWRRAQKKRRHTAKGTSG